MGALTPRYSSHPLPPHSYLPGRSRRVHFTLPPLPNPLDFEKQWPTLELYRFGIDCFNHGYPWECHEALESLWHPLGRNGDLCGQSLQTIILMAAAHVKLLSDLPHRNLAQRALDRCRERSLEGHRYGIDWTDVRVQLQALMRDARPMVLGFDPR